MRILWLECVKFENFNFQADSPIVEHRKSSAVRIQIEPNSQKLSVSDEECSQSDEIQQIMTDPPEQTEDKPPKYQIAEFIESASNLKFEIKNTQTTFRILLPTLKKITEVPEWEKVNRNLCITYLFFKNWRSSTKVMRNPYFNNYNV